MHRLVGVIIKDYNTIYDDLAPYNEQDDNYFEKIDEITKEKFCRYYSLNDPNYKNKTYDEIWKDAKHYYDYVEDDIAYNMYNLNGMFDWFQIGGRYTGLLVPKSKHKGMLGSPSWCNKDEEPKGFDCVRIRDIDWNESEISKTDIQEIFIPEIDLWLTENGNEYINKPKYNNYWLMIIDCHI